ncbi:bifunctional diguanylate cyclase/phosphodiesterase [Bacillus sp. AFS017336]|uniref:sensor domain-containing protein n=1 Tax=Bacillus sp. AFS017336 TaxID=2033489 RepID=UPI000BF0BACA|nr:bifunctional diguanylate cyclase/phosphodiesterase [Bacillus sp. AFS017336]PEL06707.1 GGDEF domain-containing protein [Bacillus sp. AFS017336]
MQKNWGRQKKISFYAVFYYLLFSTIWIFLSDSLIEHYMGRIDSSVAILKGLIYIIITAMFFYYILIKKNKEDSSVEDRYRMFVENSSDILVIVDLTGVIEYTSPSVHQLLGYEQSEYEGKSIFEFLEEDVSLMKEEFHNRKTFKDTSQFKVRFEHKNGYKVVLESKCIPIVDDQGEVQWLMYFAQDITLQTQSERKLMESEERYQKLVKYSPETTLIYGLDGKILYINSAGLKLVGANNINQVVGKYVFEFLTKESIETAQKDIEKVIAGEIIKNEYSLFKQDGTIIFTEALSYLTVFQGIDALQVVARDITERKRTAEKLEYLAYYDQLTGIGNQNALYKQIDIALRESNELNQSMSIMFMDLDRFKNINDTFGHSFGDKMLQKVTERLKLSVGNHCELFRFDGDSFVIILKNSDSKKPRELVKKIHESFSKSLMIDERNIHVTFSIGISMYPVDGETVEVLFQNADTAMNTVKETGKNGYNFYSEQVKLANDRKMELEIGIRKALENDEFSIHYQPQIDLESNQIIGLEALIRWQHPKYGFIPPIEFIPVAEETGLINLLGKWVLKTACHQFKNWLNEGIPLKSIAVNVSGVQFRDKEFVDIVNQTLIESNLEPSYLDLEITESVTQEIIEATKIMNELKALGIRLSIDDFGTGYSSFSYLQQFPFDKLKIDKAFIDEINASSNSVAIVSAIIDLGNKLGYDMVAEGVETETQVEFLQIQNCKYAQGYYYSKPLPVEDLDKKFHDQLKN